MRYLLSLFIPLLMAVSAHADCAGTGLSVFPYGRNISQNSIFIIDGYAESQHVVLDLNTRHAVYLKSGNKKIKLLVTEICVGDFFLTQALLKPETELESGLQYTLCIDDLPEYESLGRYNSKTDNYEPLTYQVVSGKDMKKPLVSSKPKELGKTLMHFGCGPSIHVVFDNPSKDDSEVIVRTTVKNIKTGKETTYYLQPDRNKLKVGHGMCSGAFTFDEGEQYEVEFSFMDASGNVTAWTGERIRFTKPVKATDDE